MRLNPPDVAFAVGYVAGVYLLWRGMELASVPHAIAGWSLVYASHQYR